MNYFTQESQRLKYRKLRPADIPKWVEFFINNDRLQYLGIDLQRSNEFLAEEWINFQFPRYENHGLGHLAVELKDGGDFIGMGGILPRDLNGSDEYEIAYSLIPKYWGNGYATEIAQTMRKFGIANINPSRFISIIAVENIASAKVARKNGMQVLFQTEYLGMKVDVYGINKPF